MPSGDNLEVYTGSSRSDLVLYSTPGVPDGVLRINIGGQKLVAVSLELLTVAGESKLSVMATCQPVFSMCPTLNPKPYTLNPKPYTLYPKP